MFGYTEMSPRGFAPPLPERNQSLKLARLLFRHGDVLAAKMATCDHLTVACGVVRAANPPSTLRAARTWRTPPVSVGVDRAVNTPQLLESLHGTPPLVSRCSRSAAIENHTRLSLLMVPLGVAPRTSGFKPDVVTTRLQDRMPRARFALASHGFEPCVSSV